MVKYGEAQLNQILLLKTTMEMVPKLLEAMKSVESGRLKKIEMVKFLLNLQNHILSKFLV